MLLCAVSVMKDVMVVAFCLVLSLSRNDNQSHIENTIQIIIYISSIVLPTISFYMQHLKNETNQVSLRTRRRKEAIYSNLQHSIYVPLSALSTVR